jgi:hypothetical protein
MHKCLLSAVLAGICCLFQVSLAGATTFEFLRAGEFHGVSSGQLPYAMERDGITLQALAAFGPVDFNDYLSGNVEPAKFINSTDTWGMGIDSDSITNAAFDEQFGNDLQSESLVFNYLESVTLSFDHTVFITELAFGDLEQLEKFIIETDTGLRTEIIGATPWTKGNSGSSTWTGAGLAGLDGLLLERGTRITFTFDTVDPLDRVPDGTGNNLDAGPSAGIRWIKVAPPAEFSIGNPFVVQGGATEAIVGVELWGDDAELTLYWGQDPDSGWDYQVSLGSRSPVMITDAIMDNLSANSTWYFMFEADNGSETIQSSMATFAWAADLYVSPEGNDLNDGLDASTPLLTIEEALRRIRAMARRPQPEGPMVPNFYFEAESPYGAQLDAHLANLVDPVTVWLMPGYHYLPDTVQIDKTIDGNIHFKGLWADGAEDALRDRLEIHGDDPDWMDPPATHMPVVSGGRTIDEWSSTTVNGVPAWIAELPEVLNGDWYFHQLFVNGKRAVRSRWPKEGWFRMEEVDNDTRLAFRVSERDTRDIDIANLANLNDVQTVTLHRWVETRNRIDSFNTDTRWIALQPPAADPTFDFNASHPVHGAGLAPYYFDNVFETMSEPGEFYLDRSTGRLYYIPLPGENMATAHVVAPRLKELVRVLGKEAGSQQANERIWNVTFHRIAFLHTQVDDFALHTGTGNSPYNSGRGALHFRYARAPRVEACLFGHVGEFGVEFAEETAGGLLSASLFRSMAFGGFKMWQSNSVANLEQRSGWVTVSDNDALGHGRYWHGGVSMLIGETVFTTVEHNHVRNGFYTGIRVAGGNTLLRYGFSNMVRKNRVHDVGLGVLSDLAGLYVPGKSPHSIVEGNVVHDVHARDYQSQTVYLDGQAEYWTVRDNWLYGTNERSVTIKGWTQNIHNNVIAFNSGDGLIDRRNGDSMSADSEVFPLIDRAAPIVTGNIFLLAGSGFVYQKQSYTDTIQPWAVLDNNLYWNQTDRMWMMADGKTLAEFQAAESQDLNSVEQDPLFADPQRGDFRLDPDSPAVQLFGFQPTDNRDAGVRESVWNAAGAVSYSMATDPIPQWLPSDVPGLEGWLDAADLAKAGPLSQWNNKTPYSFMMRQFDTDLQPEVVLNARNGLPVVRFDGAAWMGTHEYAWRTRRYSGQFRDREFTIIIVHGAQHAGEPVLSKGTTGDNGEWVVDTGLNWNGVNRVGGSEAGFAVRAWRRGPASWEAFLNGQLVDSGSSGLDYDFTSEEVLYLGSDGNGSLLQGDVAEVLVYVGHVSNGDLADIQSYLADKWMADIPPQAVIFSSDGITENTAAYASPYLRSLTTHLTGEWDPSEITFEKVSGPAWLSISPDGTLSGTPSAGDAGINSFEVRARNGAGEVHLVSLEISVAAPNPAPSSPVEEIRISVDAGRVELQWDPSPDPDFSHFVILQSPDLSGGFTEAAAPVWENHYSEEWTGGERRFYVVKPVNTSGN